MADTKAHELAKKQKEIGVAEFFARNRHLLGFDNKRKALLTTIKEAVDNALDACEEADILPEISVEIIDMGNDRFKVIVEDNGPGIVKKNRFLTSLLVFCMGVSFILSNNLAVSKELASLPLLCMVS